MAWEYKTIKVKARSGWSSVTINSEELDAVLNKLGTDNWELVGTISLQILGTGDEVYLNFKRPSQ